MRSSAVARGGIAFATDRFFLTYEGKPITNLGMLYIYM
jgi:hypothetical protein